VAVIIRAAMADPRLCEIMRENTRELDRHQRPSR
jgi:hypothetical protein